MKKCAKCIGLKDEIRLLQKKLSYYSSKGRSQADQDKIDLKIIISCNVPEFSESVINTAYDYTCLKRGQLEWAVNTHNIALGASAALAEKPKKGHAASKLTNSILRLAGFRKVNVPTYSEDLGRKTSVSQWARGDSIAGMELWQILMQFKIRTEI